MARSNVRQLLHGHERESSKPAAVASRYHCSGASLHAFFYADALPRRDKKGAEFQTRRIRSDSLGAAMQVKIIQFPFRCYLAGKPFRELSSADTNTAFI